MRPNAPPLPSPPPDFAESAPALQAFRPARPGAAGPRPLRLWSCGCGTEYLRRIHRSWWMRLLPGFGQYVCLRCDRRVLRPRLRQQLFFTVPSHPPAQRDAGSRP